MHRSVELRRTAMFCQILNDVDMDCLIPKSDVWSTEVVQEHSAACHEETSESEQRRPTSAGREESTGFGPRCSRAIPLALWHRGLLHGRSRCNLSKLRTDWNSECTTTQIVYPGAQSNPVKSSFRPCR